MSSNIVYTTDVKYPGTILVYLFSGTSFKWVDTDKTYKNVKRQLNFVKNICGYDQVELITMYYRDKLNVKQISNKYSGIHPDDVMNEIKKALDLVKKYNAITEFGFDECETNYKLSPELEEVKVPFETIKKLADNGIYTPEMVIKSKNVKKLLNAIEYDQLIKCINPDKIGNYIEKISEGNFLDPVNDYLNHFTKNYVEKNKLQDIYITVRRYLNLSTSVNFSKDDSKSVSPKRLTSFFKKYSVPYRVVEEEDGLVLIIRDESTNNKNIKYYSSNNIKPQETEIEYEFEDDENLSPEITKEYLKEIFRGGFNVYQNDKEDIVVEDSSSEKKNKHNDINPREEILLMLEEACKKGIIADYEKKSFIDKFTLLHEKVTGVVSKKHISMITAKSYIKDYGYIIGSFDSTINGWTIKKINYLSSEGCDDKEKLIQTATEEEKAAEVYESKKEDNMNDNNNIRFNMNQIQEALELNIPITPIIKHMEVMYTIECPNPKCRKTQIVPAGTKRCNNCGRLFTWPQNK